MNGEFYFSTDQTVGLSKIDRLHSLAVFADCVALFIHFLTLFFPRKSGALSLSAAAL